MGAVGYGLSAAIAVAGANQARKAYEIEAQQKAEHEEIQKKQAMQSSAQIFEAAKQLHE